MRKLLPEEVELIGKWIPKGDSVIPDDVCERIKWLLSTHLQKIGYSKKSGAWETLYQDPDDGRFWILIYPQSEMHGGGPPALKCIQEGLAKADYDFG